MFGSAKLVMIGIVAIGLSGGAAYVYKLKADNAVLKENNIKLEESVSSQQAVIEQQKKDFSNIKAIVSYADPEKNHKGGIYQAMNWIYIGKTSSSKIYIENGKEIHSKTISDRIRFKKLDKNHNLEYKVVKGKYKYVYLFDKSFADKLNKLKKPYP
mgnify:CR=1 FL=1